MLYHHLIAFSHLDSTFNVSTGLLTQSGVRSSVDYGHGFSANISSAELNNECMYPFYLIDCKQRMRMVDHLPLNHCSFRRSKDKLQGVKIAVATDAKSSGKGILM
jgi:hypothetical protein